MSLSPRPLRVAVVGSGPAGFYAAGFLLAHEGRPVEVDMLERLPTPWGLVRSGVAPDHPRIKSVTRIFEKTAGHARFRWYGNVEVGRHVSRDELLERYDAIVYAIGAEAGRPLAIPGADLPGVAPATRFVGWYNGHPDHRDADFDLSAERAVVIGNGNVALDVARLLSVGDDELRTTDIADHALDALRASRIRDVTLLGRRGPVQAAFTTPELRELGALAGADVVVDRAELPPDDAGEEALDGGAPATTKRNLAVLRDFAARERDASAARTITLRFRRAPVAIVGDGRAEGVVVAVTELVRHADGTVAARPTGRTELLPAGLVLSSIGYRGRPVAGLPFDEARGLIPNDDGRVAGREREYVTGWIKRGPSGIIGTNKKCAHATVERLLADLGEPAIERPSAQAAADWLRERRPRVVTARHWAAIDRHERRQGAPAGRPRVKLTRLGELLAVAHGA
jgi:ferredoxin/flavodoxin---NADP+ reductase